MVDLDTFLTTVYVSVEDECCLPPDPPQRGPAPSLSRSELLTLAIVSQWAAFPSERAFYRYAQRRLRAAFPTLPSRAQFNRLVRHWHDSLVAVGRQVARRLDAPTGAYEVIDGMGVATRNAKRRGAGWLAGQADIGLCTRLGWYEGLHLLTVVTPQGAITGFGLAPASTKDQPLAETLLAARAVPQPALPSAGQPAASNLYLLDKGYEGQQWHQRWAEQFGVQVVCPPKRADQHRRWSRALRRQIAGLRQVVETVHDLLLTPFRLEHERPHCLRGLQARLAAKVALHNLCLWLNQYHGRPLLAFADLIDW
jgi:transposase